jgi:hypothetical protein
VRAAAPTIDEVAVRQRLSIWLALVAIHIVAGVCGWAGRVDPLAAIVAGSIYLPLWPFSHLRVPVLGSTAWYFPPPTPLGWVIVTAFWLVVYWYVAGLIAWLLARRRRAA